MGGWKTDGGREREVKALGGEGGLQGGCGGHEGVADMRARTKDSESEAERRCRLSITDSDSNSDSDSTLLGRSPRWPLVLPGSTRYSTTFSHLPLSFPIISLQRGQFLSLDVYL